MRPKLRLYKKNNYNSLRYALNQEFLKFLKGKMGKKGKEEIVALQEAHSDSHRKMFPRIVKSQNRKVAPAKMKIASSSEVSERVVEVKEDAAYKQSRTANRVLINTKCTTVNVTIFYTTLNHL